MKTSCSHFKFHRTTDSFIEQWKRNYATMSGNDMVQTVSHFVVRWIERVDFYLDLESILDYSRHGFAFELVDIGQSSRCLQWTSFSHVSLRQYNNESSNDFSHCFFSFLFSLFSFIKVKSKWLLNGTKCPMNRQISVQYLAEEHTYSILINFDHVWNSFSRLFAISN